MKMTQMKAAQVSKPRADLDPSRARDSYAGCRTRARQSALGVSTVMCSRKEGLWPGMQYPRVPGHEVAGIIDDKLVFLRGSCGLAWRPGRHVCGPSAEIFAIAGT